MSHDPFHCNCFAIDPRHSVVLQTNLLNNGYFNPFQENHGQTFGLARNLDDTLQFHIKTMPNGKIEAEIEPQTQYVEHLNQNYSSPAHFQIKQVLDAFKIPYRQISSSVACISGKIKRPPNATSVVGVIVGALVVVGLFAILFRR